MTTILYLHVIMSGAQTASCILFIIKHEKNANRLPLLLYTTPRTAPHYNMYVALKCCASTLKIKSLNMSVSDRRHHFVCHSLQITSINAFFFFKRIPVQRVHLINQCVFGSEFFDLIYRLFGRQMREETHHNKSLK